jgi:ribokinase
MAEVDSIQRVLLQLRKRGGLKAERLRTTEVDLSRLVTLPAVESAVAAGVPVEDTVVRVVTEAADRLLPPDKIVADAVLSLDLLRDRMADRADLLRVYADDLGERRAALADHWTELHALLDATPSPATVTVRGLRGSLEAATLGRLAEECVGAPSSAPARPVPTDAKSVVVVGGAVMDQIFVVDFVPEPGRSTQAVTYRMHPGGKGLNLAVALHRQDLNSQLVAAVGGDEPARAIVSYLAEAGLPTGLVKETPGAKTPTTAVLVTPSGDASYVGWMNETQVGLSITDLHRGPIRDAIASADALLVTFEPSVEVIKWSLATATTQRNKPLVLLQPSPPIAAPQGVYRYLGGVDYLVGREWELRALLSDPDGPADLEAVAQQLLNLGVHAVCSVEDFRCRLWTVELSRDIEAPEVPLNDTPASRGRFSAALIRQLLNVGRNISDTALDYAVTAMATNPSIEEFTDSAPTVFEVDRAQKRQDQESPS